MEWRTGPCSGKGETVTLERETGREYLSVTRDMNVDHSALYRMDQQQQISKGFFEAVQRHSAKDSGLVVRLFERFRNTWSLI